MIEVEELRSLALAAARVGGAAAGEHFRRPGLDVEWKADASPVTIADRSAEDAIRAFILGARPDDGWIGEETGRRVGGSGVAWIVDPIDGTRNFVRGIPLWSVLIACVSDDDDERLLASAVGFPALGEWYDAVAGGGARCNGNPIRVSRVARLAEAGFAYYTHALFRQHGMEEAFRELSRQCQMARGGGDAYMHALVASGRMDVCVETALQVWDLAATTLLVREAGGRVSRLDGGEDGLQAGGLVLSNGLLHQATLGVIADQSPR